MRIEWNLYMIDIMLMKLHYFNITINSILVFVTTRDELKKNRLRNSRQRKNNGPKRAGIGSVKPRAKESSRENKVSQRPLPLHSLIFDLLQPIWLKSQQSLARCQLTLAEVEFLVYTTTRISYRSRKKQKSYAERTEKRRERSSGEKGGKNIAWHFLLCI